MFWKQKKVPPFRKGGYRRRCSFLRARRGQRVARVGSGQPADGGCGFSWR